MQLLIYKENSTNCYFSIYLLGWEALVKYLRQKAVKLKMYGKQRKGWWKGQGAVPEDGQRKN